MRPGGPQRKPPMMRRLEQAAEWVNPFLMIAAIALLLVDLSVFAAVEVAHLAPG